MKALALLASMLVASLGASPPPSANLLQRALDPNPTLRSYVASATVSAELHAVLPLHKSASGTAYYLRPQRTIVLNDLSGALSRFRELTASLPTYAALTAQYAIAPPRDDGTTSTFVLTPATPGRRVKSLTVQVTDATALIAHVQFAYVNGGSLNVTPLYGAVGTYELPSQESISARFPGYSVDGTLQLTNYQPNVPVSPSVFATPSGATGH